MASTAWLETAALAGLGVATLIWLVRGLVNEFRVIRSSKTGQQ